MSKRPNSSRDYMGTFLDTAQRLDAEQTPSTKSNADATGDTRDLTQPSAAGQSPTVTVPLGLLVFINYRPGQSVQELYAQAGLSFAEFSSALEELKQAGLVSVTGSPGAESCTVTAEGQKMARLITKE